VIRIGKKNKKINVIKNPQDQDPTFVFDPVKQLMMKYADQHTNNSMSNSSDNDKNLVKKARHDLNRFSKSDLKNTSKHGLSKQSHSPVYE
jgi:hypothetical protein